LNENLEQFENVFKIYDTIVMLREVSLAITKEGTSSKVRTIRQGLEFQEFHIFDR